MNGYFGIGILGAKTESNVGGLWRTAHALGASYVFTIARRYRRQASDTSDATNHLPLYHFQAFEDMKAHRPSGTCLIGLENSETAENVRNFCHPKRAIYLLGAEDNGLPLRVMEDCQYVVRLPGIHCLNVATAGSIIMYDRWLKSTQKPMHIAA